MVVKRNKSSKAPATPPAERPKPATMELRRVPLTEIHPAAYNPRRITDAAKAGLRNAIERFGLVQPLVWNKRSGNLVGGHQRFEVLREMGEVEAEVTVVDLSEADERALNLTLNNAAIQGSWDDGKLETLLADMVEIPDFDADLLSGLRIDTLLAKFAEDEVDLTGFFDDDDEDPTPPKRQAAPEQGREPESWPEPDREIGTPGEGDQSPEVYTQKITTPVYEPHGERPEVAQLYDTAKTDELIAAVTSDPTLPDDVRAFLIAAAQRHTVFHFKRIAEFYAHASPSLQRLMEASALVIIDYNDALANGFVRVSKRLGAIADKNLEERGDGDGDGGLDDDEG